MADSDREAFVLDATAIEQLIALSQRHAAQLRMMRRDMLLEQEHRAEAIWRARRAEAWRWPGRIVAAILGFLASITSSWVADARWAQDISIAGAAWLDTGLIRHGVLAAGVFVPNWQLMLGGAGLLLLVWIAIAVSVSMRRWRRQGAAAHAPRYRSDAIVTREVDVIGSGRRPAEDEWGDEDTYDDLTVSAGLVEFVGDDEPSDEPTIEGVLAAARERSVRRSG